MKTREQLNVEYTTTLKQLKRFCGQMIGQTGRGAPEMDTFSTTILNIETAWKQPSQALEEVVRERMQESIAFYRHKLAELDLRTRCPLSDRVIDTRKLAAYDDLWRCMETSEWTIPKAIAPLVLCLVIDPLRPGSFDAFFSALYHAHVCDLRPGCVSRAWGKEALCAQTFPASYQRIPLSSPNGLAELRSAVERKVIDPLTLLLGHTQHEMEAVLTRQFPDVEFVFLPKLLPAILL